MTNALQGDILCNVFRKLAVVPRKSKSRPESFGIQIKFTEDLSLLK